VVICADRSDPSVTAAIPVPDAKQLGAPALLGPVTVTDIPVLVGAAKPQGLVKIVAVTVSLAANTLFRTLRRIPTMVASADIVTVLLVNCETDEEVPRPTHPPSLTD
jgi:hypothetical protein